MERWLNVNLLYNFSSSSDKDDDNSGGGGGGGGASASGTFKDDRNGKSYKWVKIGGQVWMAENLNLKLTENETDGGVCYGVNSSAIRVVDENGDDITLSPAEKQANCDKYGRLYDLSEAKNACPEGWHLPTSSEFNVLIKFVEPSCSDSYDCAGAATKLKAKNGWNDYEGKSGNGTDNYGFNALPGGELSASAFHDIGYIGAWMISSLSQGHYIFNLYSSSEYLNGLIHGASYGNKYNVRCVKDYDISGTLKDDRDSKSYKWVKIGEQTWMAENLNYNATGSKCYAEGVSGVSADSIAKNCAKYGKLYNWTTAMALQATCADNACASQITAKHKGICPSGWHIPSDADWTALMKSVNPFGEGNYEWSNAGIDLKATSGWNDDDKGRSGNGYDTYGFSALPGGAGFGDGSFSGIGGGGGWWGTRESNNSSSAFHWSVGSSTDKVKWQDDRKSMERGVRCVKD